ncbi:hypothetical protein [Salinarimonas sp.]|uniref:hypothetical protein n=1 Tax=Salinarimonas sp. TaxID=2766526 RepID=UPI0032D99469
MADAQKRSAWDLRAYKGEFEHLAQRIGVRFVADETKLARFDETVSPARRAERIAAAEARKR